jgi:hypothetical protein
MLDFSLTASMFSALVTGLAMPITLAVAARLPWLTGRNALQFFVGSLMTVAMWAGLVIMQSDSSPPAYADLSVGLMILGAASLFYLEVWSLLSRGYTLGLLLTLYHAGGSLDDQELARRYRGGEGLSWIMKHRLSAMVRTGLIRHEGGVITLTPTLGLSVVRLYKTSSDILGLGSHSQ